MRLPRSVAFSLEWTDSVANASAHLERSELVLTCHVLQGYPGNRKSNRKVTSTNMLFFMKTRLFYACLFNSSGQKWPRKTQLGFIFSFLITFHTLHGLPAHYFMHILDLFFCHFSVLYIPVLLQLFWFIVFISLHPPLPVFCLMHLLILLLFHFEFTGQYFPVFLLLFPTVCMRSC